MILRLTLLVLMINPYWLSGQDIKEKIFEYYKLIQQEKYFEAMEYNYLAQGSEEDKTFIVNLMSGDDETPGYGTMIEEIQVLKAGEVVEGDGRSFASAKVVLSIKMPLDHLNNEEERLEEVEMMQWSFPDATYNETSKSCYYKEHLNLICIKENGKWMFTDERSYRLGLLEGIVNEEIWSKL